MTAANNMLLTTFGTIDKVTAACFEQSSLAVNSMAGAFALTGVFLITATQSPLKFRADAASQFARRRAGPAQPALRGPELPPSLSS